MAVVSEELQRLDVEQRRRAADDVGLAQRLEELLWPVEVAHPDAHGAESLGDVGVRPGARDDPILRGEALGLLVERADRHARVEDLERVHVVDDLEQVLVVGHGVHPIERMGDVDEAALALDLGHGLGEGEPPRDLLGEEEPDHLALARRLDLLGDDDLHPERRRLRGRLERAADLVVVGDRDRPEPPIARRGEQHLDRRRAVRRVVGVHVQVDVDEGAGGDAHTHRRVAAAVAPGDEPAVERLELVGHGRPRPGRGGRRRWRVERADDLGGERVGVARLEQPPARALVEDLLVHGQPRRDDRDPGAAGALEQAGLRRRPVRRGDEDAGPGQQRVLAQLVGGGEAHALAQLRAQRGRRGRPAAAEHRHAPGPAGRQAPQRPQEHAQRRALLAVDEDDVRGIAPGVGDRVDPRAQHGVGGGGRSAP